MFIRRCSTCMMPLLLWTTHQGGTLSRGSNYLTQYMPAGLKRWMPSDAKAAPDSFYAKQINPIFDSNCVACHGEGESKRRPAAGFV